jgi:glyoxylase-like metal-dependent hydrolase (beta-lactamase superfamily II)
MNAEPVTLREGIIQFPGKISRNLLLEPMVSHTYLLEDGEQVLIFDPSCGKKIARQIEAHIRKKLAGERRWKKAVVLAGHSHMDHANNFYLGELFGAEETHVYVHESGFQDGRVLNRPFAIYQKALADWSEAYNPYLSYYFPYILLTAPFAALHALSPVLARNLFSAVGAIPWPRPRDGTVTPEPLRDEDMVTVDLECVEVRGWSLGDKVVLPTPGHSPCSVSLLWPERKALFVSDAVLIVNPLLMSGSFEDCIASVEKLKGLVEAGRVDLFLPAHGQVWEGRAAILSYLDLHLRSHEVARNEILSAYRASGEKNVRRLTRFLASESPHFRLLKQGNYPRLPMFAQCMVALGLKEEGIPD